MAQGITRFRIPVDRLLDPGDRQVLGGLIIDRIREQTQNGDDFEGNPFRRYSPEYIEELRSDGLDTDVDLQVTGEMLNSITILDSRTGFITIGIPEGTEAARKAGWVQGGNPRIPSRPFMGVEDHIIDIFQEAILANDRITEARRFLNETGIIDSIASELGITTDAGVSQPLIIEEGFPEI